MKIKLFKISIHSSSKLGSISASFRHTQVMAESRLQSRSISLCRLPPKAIHGATTMFNWAMSFVDKKLLCLGMLYANHSRTFINLFIICSKTNRKHLDVLVAFSKFSSLYSDVHVCKMAPWHYSVQRRYFKLSNWQDPFRFTIVWIWSLQAWFVN